jgi:hypothetical protein
METDVVEAGCEASRHHTGPDKWTSHRVGAHIGSEESDKGGEAGVDFLGWAAKTCEASIKSSD